MNRFDVRWCKRNLSSNYTDTLNLVPECKYDKCDIDYNICLCISKVPIYQPYKKNRYDLTDKERDEIIKDLQENIQKELVVNQVREIESHKLASEFTCR